MRPVFRSCIASIALTMPALRLAAGDPGKPVQAIAGPAASKPQAVSEGSLEHVIGATEHVNDGDVQAEIARLQNQLNELKPQREAVRRARREKQAALARLASGSAEAAALRAEIAGLQTQLNNFDGQMQLLQYRIQSLQARTGNTPEMPSGPAKVAKPQPTPANVAPMRTKPVIAPERIHAAGVQLAHGSDLSTASARRAATDLLAGSQPDATGADVEALAQLVLQQASESTQDDIRSVLAEMKETNDRKAALREAAKATRDAADNPNDVSPEDRRRLMELADRHTRLEQAILEQTEKVEKSKAK
ncbi:MAG TPA: hypothetical protein VG734_24460 [Lacunisphaera sp.]|nr:hypothetical protein [Lacunisphaera sp.]